MNVKVLAAALLLGSSSFALAADPALPIEEIPTGFNWTGGYIGAQLGYTGTKADLLNDGLDIWTSSPDVDSFHVGGVAGYRYQFNNNVVLGAEADINWTSGSAEDGWAPPFLNSAEFEPNWDASIRATLGYAVDRWLPYVTGGVAFLDYDVAPNMLSYPDNKFGETAVGWTLGAGAAYAFTDNIIASVDYRYADFGETSYDTSGLMGYRTDVDLSTHKVSFGVAYKF